MKLVQALGLIPIACGILAGLPSTAAAAEVRREQVRFGAGENSVRIAGSLTGHEVVDYVLRARMGTVLVVNMTTDATANYFNLLAPGETEVAFFNASVSDNTYAGPVQESGDFTIRVYQMRNEARRGTLARYALYVEVTPEPRADGLAGGPEYWEVKTSSPVGQLNIRDAPSTGAPIVAGFFSGTILRNRGCRMAGGRRWCQVETVDGELARGWAAGSFLRESSYSQTSTTE